MEEVVSDGLGSIVDTVLTFLKDSISWLLDWFLDFFADIFTGRSIASVGSSVLNIFIHGTFDFSLKSVFELLFGVAFLILAIKILVNLIRG